jgi:hypothetical protein
LIWRVAEVVERLPVFGYLTTAHPAGYVFPGIPGRPSLNTHRKGRPVMDFTPQVETAEIADADLDIVSGGLVGGAVDSVVGTADSVAPVSQTLNTVTGAAEGAGVPAGAVTSTVASL